MLGTAIFACSQTHKNTLIFQALTKNSITSFIGNKGGTESWKEIKRSGDTAKKFVEHFSKLAVTEAKKGSRYSPTRIEV